MNVSRRQAIGGALSCLMTPFIPALNVPKKLEPSPGATFWVEHANHWGHPSVCLAYGGSLKWYRKDSVAAHILTRLYDGGPVRDTPESEVEYWLLRFLWDRHDHETSMII